MDWGSIAERQACPFLGRRCIKVRKSQPEISIGTCSVTHGRDKRPMLICPFRLLDRKQIFLDCIHLLSLSPVAISEGKFRLWPCRRGEGWRLHALSCLPIRRAGGKVQH
ncbi:MAG: NotI family restriction endonuclease [Gammaproteobacteria bacterium]|nr:NotI family restriction endonuclease [Gammaproteobacteria bacterium]